jgi:DNA mismatch repair ATPase MutS
MDEKYKDPLDAEYSLKLRECNNSLGKLQEMVETTVDLDAIDNHEYIIKPDFDDGLKVIKRKLDKAKYEIEVEHRRVGKDLNQDTEKKLMLENHRVHGWCFRLTRGVSYIYQDVLKRRYSQSATGSRSYSKQERIPGDFDTEKWCLLHHIQSPVLEERV